MRTGLWDIDRAFRDIDRTFAGFDDLRRFFEVVAPREGVRTFSRVGGLPLANVYDAGADLVVELVVPGLTEKDISLSASREAITVNGERKITVPEGYSAQRIERGGSKFSRSFALPVKIDPEKVSATLKNGVLTITAAKLPELQPRQIEIKVN